MESESDVTEYGPDLQLLADSFSSDVINDAISEIVADEDLKEADEAKWYRQKLELTPTLEAGERVERVSRSSTSESTSGSTMVQREMSVSMEKVSPILSPRSKSRPISGQHNHDYADEPATSSLLKDVPGYVSPNTRQKMLNDAGFQIGSAEEVPKADSSSDESCPITTLICDNAQDTVYEEVVSARKNSVGSFSSGVDEKSSVSNPCRQRSEGTSSVGSTTVYNSIASGVFGHKKHLSPLLDMSGRSGQVLQSPDSNKSSPRDRSGSRLRESPRELQSQLSSVTEYEALPCERKEGRQSPGNSSHLHLSPDLAQRVSDILNQTEASPISKLTFSEARSSSTASTPRDSARVKSRASTDSSLTQDELDKRVTHVLNQSAEVARSVPSPRQQVAIDYTAEDHSYLDKYLSPQSASFDKLTSRSSPHQPSNVYVSPTCLSLRLSTADRAALSVSGGRPDSELSSARSDGSGRLNTKYMDKSSRQVLEQAAEEYYRTVPKSAASPETRQNKNDTARLSNTSELSEELAHLVDTSTSPRVPETSPTSKTLYDRPAVVPSPRMTQADTQSIVAKRLDRIEFMVLSALNEVPPQSRHSFIPPAEYEENIACEEMTPQDRSILDSNDVIRKGVAHSPLTGLPDYSLEQPRSSHRKAREESFNVSISPVKKEPFTAFNRAQDLLAERLNQRSNERTPGRRLSSRSCVTSTSASPPRSPTRDHSYTSSESKADAAAHKSRPGRSTVLENIPEPLPLEITEAGRSPPCDLAQNKKSKGRSHSITSLESATTVESSHPESDDAQPPLLPKEAFGTRKEPKKSTSGIYGTRTPKGTPFDSHLAPRANSAIGRAEEALLRGEELRDQIQARRDERARRLHSYTLDKEETRCSSSQDKVHVESSVHEKSTEPRRDELEKPVEAADHSSIRIVDGDVPFDFYTPPRVTSKESRRLREKTADQDLAHISQSSSAETCEEEKEISLQRKKEPIHDSYSLERPPSGVPLARSRSASPQSSPVSSPSRCSPKLDLPRASASKQRDSRRYRPGGAGRRVRPLERVDYQLEGQFRSKLSQTINDRLRTYHILREELMRAEDELKGRDLNLAWQRISKRKPKSGPVLEESCSSNTSASSEMFDEQKMEKLKSLLNNPLGHLVSKAKKGPPGQQAKKGLPGQQANKTKKLLSRAAAQADSTKYDASQADNAKYDKLMLKIEQQREEASASSQSTLATTLSSSDETFCSRCDAKRSMKRAKKEPKSQSDSDEKLDSCSTRPVTPTGLPVPTIKASSSRGSVVPGHSVRNNGQYEARLRDVGVMCPSPSMDPPEVKERKQKRNKELAPKLCQKAPAEKEAIAWFNNEKRDCDKRENTFQKARSLDRGQDGLVWFVPYNNPRPWSKSPKERQALAVSAEPWPAGNMATQTASQKRDVMDICEAFNKATGRTGYVPTLQEAFRERNRQFISHSRERQRLINLRAEERQITKVHDEQRARLFDFQPQNHRPATLKRHETSCPRRAIPKEEMYDRTSRNYRVLPEVRNKAKEDVIQRERIAYRLKAKLFNKKVQRHVLERARLTNLVGQRKSAQMRS